jgi:hypothetical protein
MTSAMSIVVNCDEISDNPLRTTMFTGSLRRPPMCVLGAG